MLDLLAYPFVQRALAAAFLVSIACGVMGALVVVNRMTFLAGGVAHAGYGGVGLAFFAGWPVLPTAAGFSVLAALAAGLLSRRRDERMDVTVGLLWAGGMAFGVLLLDLTEGYNVDLMSYLFGSILTVGPDTLSTMALLVALLVGLVGLFYRPLLALSLDREFAHTRGLPVGALHLLLLGLIALAVMTAVPAIGLVLVIALLTTPAHLAERHAGSLAGMMVLASLWAFAFCLIGLGLAFWLDLTSGAAIIAVAVASVAVAELLPRRKRIARPETG
ncbi:metal ABC transporter permease [Roseospirillum parvum]|uniref:Zinc transport system permease protein n=1 Tax=Roseospirillum parvum TaxID=83401 RepID=A0A1G7ZM26_9PROT|nr:metal ABC transporter permease [Roseospirillum parvum]SDH09160.1 zinc transport system permease protein [Roseospirillum parvum]